MGKSNKVLVWGLVAVAASCGLCGLGTLALAALGLLSGDDSPGDGTAAPTAHAAAQPGAPGGFAFDPPQGWTSPGQGRVLQQQKDEDKILSVEVIRLPAVPGLDGAEAKLAQLWTQRVAADWQGVSGTPPHPAALRLQWRPRVLRRGGAAPARRRRAHTREPLPRGGGRPP